MFWKKGNKGVNALIYNKTLVSFHFMKMNIFIIVLFYFLLIKQTPKIIMYNICWPVHFSFFKQGNCVRYNV